ncbi:hypothetical protein ACOMHN_050774 [Nucella lapillus]
MAGRGILAEVGESLRRSELYSPAHVFVEKLWLCVASEVEKERCFLRMRDLAREKGAQGWLKGAARAINTFQLRNLAWIRREVAHIAGPSQKRRAPEPTDFSSGRMDIRLKNNPDFPRMLVRCWQRSPSPSSSAIREDRRSRSSGRSRSPRRSRKRTRSPQRSPERPPRISFRKSPHSSSRHSSPTPERSPRVAGPATSRRRTTCTSTTTGRQSSSSPKEEMVRTVHMELEPQPSLIASTGQSDRGSRRRKFRQKGRFQQQRKAQASVGFATPQGVGYQKTKNSVFRRTVPSRWEAVATPTTVGVIAPPSVVNQECLEPQTESCWVYGCTKKQANKRLHAMTHVPNIFDLRVNPSRDSVMEERKLALRQAATWLLGRPSPVTELLAYVDRQHLLTPSDWTECSTYPDMEAFCTYMDQPLPGKVTLCPLNSVGALLHWKVLLVISACLDPRDRGVWLQNFRGQLHAPTPVALTDHRPRAFDAHFHLDRTLHELGLPVTQSLRAVLERTRAGPGNEVNLVGTCASFCDPESYPDCDRLLEYLPEVTLAIGLHPKKCARRSNTQDLHQLRTLLQSPHVKVVGEIGLDRGDEYVRDHWREAFPEVYFGFTRMAAAFNDAQIAALQGIETRYILLETDAPYFHPPGRRVSSPNLLHSVAECVAPHLNMSPRELLELTADNALRLFQ